MLNKDEYNQDEYNDYYAKETRGAEISSKKDDSGGGKKIVLIVLLLAVIGIGGYFGLKSTCSSNNKDSVDKTVSPKNDDKEENKVDKSSKAVEEKNSITKEVVKENVSKTSEENKISKAVETAVSTDSSNEKMNSEDIANIVQMVMQKMNKEKDSEASTKSSEPATEDEVKDNKLVKSLSDTEVDSLVSQLEKVDVLSDKDKSKKATSTETTDTYNKVLVEKESTVENDELSKLSDEISNIIADEEGTKKDTSKYTEGVTKEVKDRKKEMRYITVKKGDTLGKIAKKVYGNVMDYKKIYEANPDILRRPDKVYIGQRLRVPE